MSKSSQDRQHFNDIKHDLDDDEYEEMELLERLESLREDMEDLGVTTLGEVLQRIEELHHKLDLQ